VRKRAEVFPETRSVDSVLDSAVIPKGMWQNVSRGGVRVLQRKDPKGEHPGKSIWGSCKFMQVSSKLGHPFQEGKLGGSPGKASFKGSWKGVLPGMWGKTSKEIPGGKSLQ